MGRGDRKTKKGKIFRGSSGNTRMKNKKPATILSQPEIKKAAPRKAAEPVKTVKKEAPEKKAAVEKKATVEKKAAVEKKAPEKKPAPKKAAEK